MCVFVRALRFFPKLPSFGYYPEFNCGSAVLVSVELEGVYPLGGRMFLVNTQGKMTDMCSPVSK